LLDRLKLSSKSTKNPKKDFYNFVMYIFGLSFEYFNSFVLLLNTIYRILTFEVF